MDTETKELLKVIAAGLAQLAPTREISPLDDQRLSIQECAELLGISYSRLLAMIAQPDCTFPVQRLSKNGTAFVLRRNLEKWYGQTTLTIAKIATTTNNKNKKTRSK